ncbi:Hormone-sensitive lipase [Tolypocladium ophioglossoides CBS 100239]|uniref:Hormone-sensitive lipase n=1 Tax=Tolypocladium ophioglossoides (strain CBS 100239) TaxID=1163406 RepID=A0A0L0NJA7_TOLOC|nr:Hormone-sensitive lipase [Tolypocladium ophioglossoides CBS 100239]
MIDHVLGRPSSKSRRLQVLAVLSFWSFYLYRGDKHGPPGAKLLSRIFSRRLTAWQTFLMTMMYLYAARNFSALVGLASPEPMANMYDTTYFRATWVLTALDAGFWTAMKIRTKWLRDIASIAFSLFYLVAAERADEKVRKVRGMVTVEHLRVSWNKGTTPYLGFVQRLLRPRFTRWPPRQIRIPRPVNSDYKEPVAAWLYYDGPVADLEHHTRVILDMPGGGFVAMDPRCNDDKLFAWASKSGLPILSIDYKKAPEFPYPYALNECFDVYATLVKTKGRCLGMSGTQVPRVILTGDSAGGNLAVAAALMILETSSGEFRRFSGRGSLPAPDGLVCFYPALDMNIGNWMSDEQMSLIRDRKMRKTNRSIVRRKSMQYNELVGTPHHSDDEDDTPLAEDRPVSATEAPNSPNVSQPQFSHSGPQSLSQSATEEKHTDSMSHHAEPMKTRLATSSMISYFNDRVLTPEMMRAMIILYIGAHNRPDFTQDYLLSPVLAPEALLAKFPKTYFMTGERDPLVDDTVVFAGRLRRAKEAAAREQLGRAGADGGAYDDAEAAEVMLIPGISHGFMQFPGIYPPAWRHFERSAVWFEQLFLEAEQARTRDLQPEPLLSLTTAAERVAANGHAHHLGESSGDEDKPLEISMTKMTRGRGAAQTQGSPPATNGEAERANGNGKKGKKMLSKNRSLVKLNSTDDLLGRRMQGLASGLTGLGEQD